MNRTTTAAVLGVLAGAVPVALTRRRAETTLTDEVVAAYKRGYEAGRIAEWRYVTERPAEDPDARHIAGPTLVKRWQGLGLGYYAARLREVDRRTRGLNHGTRASQA